MSDTMINIRYLVSKVK